MSSPDKNKTSYNSIAAKVDLAIIAGDLRAAGMVNHAELIDAVIVTHLNRSVPSRDGDNITTGDKIRSVISAYVNTDNSLSDIAIDHNMYASDVERIISRCISSGVVKGDRT